MPSATKTLKIFVTGATGYIGGDALKAIADTYPEQVANITALVRDAKRGASLTAAYPKVNVVYGSLDDTSLIQSEAAKADIIINLANADHVPATNAIVAGLKQRAAEGSQSFLIHVSGTGILMFRDVETNTYGETSDKIFDDWENINEVTSLPDAAFHRDVDKIVLAAGEDELIKTAIVCPPTIYGIGRGACNQRSAQIPMLAEAILKTGKGFQVGEGKAEWTNVHVYDLSDLFAKLLGQALVGGGKASWGPEGYYFAQNGEHVWGEICTKITSIAFSKGLINSPEVTKFSPEETEQVQPFGSRIWGQNSRCKAIRARSLLGWAPSGRSLEDELPTAVEYEAQRLAA
ncbi:hypothetical protein H2202_001323 [Exophiala xenobiotica]|nr:hypothetical protein H2202_001323 [Exophiala xenobiotica]KAK5208858.1 hypothetical protein LTR41_005255 [Exophiala xenobiotica]KAK5324937.1 hypothetical protein LTR93_004412 [Exophiala xenobiotica]KAK5370219.1 hypothetical protein LTS13_006809 [Exophiala xenobiotica]KAK5397525.1 hypothetical protein LTR79_005038 [Exophiala xenobiotica]